MRRKYSWALGVLAAVTTGNLEQPAMARTPNQCVAETRTVDQQAFAAMRGRLQEVLGFVDGIRIYKNGCLIASTDIQRDYQALYKGTLNPVGEYDYRSPVLHPFYKGTKLHTLQSVSKSVTSLTYAVALKRGDIRSLDRHVLDYFDQSTVANRDARKAKLRVRHLLGMTSGIDFRDDPDGTDDTKVMEEQTADWAAFVISKPMAADPGTRFRYSNGDAALLAYIFQKETGIDIIEYARRHLFGPIGIADFHWKRAPNGVADTEGGLYLKIEDLAKIGMLVANRGQSNGSALFDPVYLDAADALPTNEANLAYHRQWWVAGTPCPDEVVWSALGYGGQYLLIFPSRNMVATINSWNIYEHGRRNLPSVTIPEILAVLSKQASACPVGDAEKPK